MRPEYYFLMALGQFVLWTSCTPQTVSKPVVIVEYKSSLADGGETKDAFCERVTATMMTMECASVTEECSVPGNSELPLKSYDCGHGLLKYQTELCNQYDKALTVMDLNQAKCQVKDKSEH
jgi:hypothetical protein